MRDDEVTVREEITAPRESSSIHRAGMSEPLREVDPPLPSVAHPASLDVLE